MKLRKAGWRFSCEELDKIMTLLTVLFFCFLAFDEVGTARRHACSPLCQVRGRGCLSGVHLSLSRTHRSPA
ncbi:hypothetical protein BRADI_5g14636v3 [Brachypodium distachyon]|uniref:Uncharacterized protein n=1 Tax=Brachypodium distachyon TaxID=15368 RepID=A0A2K2CH65_BRADI|nr:hypothetical protein BRADI_5g14636v3 [Brachypodium distachyon]